MERNCSSRRRGRLIIVQQQEVLEPSPLEVLVGEDHRRRRTADDSPPAACRRMRSPVLIRRIPALWILIIAQILILLGGGGGRNPVASTGGREAAVLLVNGFAPVPITTAARNSRPGAATTTSSTCSSRTTPPASLCIGSRARRMPFLSSSLIPGSSTADQDQEDEVAWQEVLTPHNEDGSLVILDQHLPPTSSSAQYLESINRLPVGDMTRKDLAVTALFTTATIWMFYKLIAVYSGVGAWRYYLAGGICAAVSHTVPVPIDVVKTRKQVDPNLSNKNMIEATRYIIKNDGPMTLLAGLGPTTFGYLLEGALKFGVYEVLKPFVTRYLVSNQLMAFVMCAACSGIAASIVLSPMEALRIRLVAEPGFAPQGWIQGGYRMLKLEGIACLLKGIKPMLYKQVPYTVVKNVSFDQITKAGYGLLRDFGVGLTPSIKLGVPLLSAMMASVLSCISSQPGDMLLSLVNAHEDDKRRTSQFVHDILHSELGVRGFFVGIKTRLLHVGLIVTLQLLLYDIIKRLCGIAATGM